MDTRFAQNAMKPQEVAPEWERASCLLGSPARFNVSSRAGENRQRPGWVSENRFVVVQDRPGHQKPSSLCPLPDFPQCPVEEMPGRPVAGLGIAQDDALHLVVALEHSDGAFEKGFAKCRKHHIGRVVAQHFGQVVIHDFTVDLLETDKVLARERRPMAVIERLDDLGEGTFFLFRVRFGGELADRRERLGVPRTERRRPLLLLLDAECLKAEHVLGDLDVGRDFPVDRQDVGLVVADQCRIQPRGGLEEAQAEPDAGDQLDAVAKHIERATGLQGLLQLLEELASAAVVYWASSFRHRMR